MHKERGVTLIEVMMLIATIGMLTVMAIPRTVHMDKHTAYTVAHRLAVDIRYARRLAITNAKDHIVRFSPIGGPYTGYRILRKEDAGETQVGEFRWIPERITCTGTEEFTFQPRGNASSDGTVSLSAGSNQYNVNVIATTGRCEEQKAKIDPETRCDSEPLKAASS